MSVCNIHHTTLSQPTSFRSAYFCFKLKAKKFWGQVCHTIGKKTFTVAFAESWGKKCQNGNLFCPKPTHPALIYQLQLMQTNQFCDGSSLSEYKDNYFNLKKNNTR